MAFCSEAICGVGDPRKNREYPHRPLGCRLTEQVAAAVLEAGFAAVFLERSEKPVPHRHTQARPPSTRFPAQALLRSRWFYHVSPTSTSQFFHSPHWLKLGICCSFHLASAWSPQAFALFFRIGP